MPPRADSGSKRGRGGAAASSPAAAQLLARLGAALSALGALEFLAAWAVGHPFGIFAASLAVIFGVAVLAVAACQHEAESGRTRVKLPPGTPSWISSPPREAVKALSGLVVFVGVLLFVRVVSRGPTGAAAHAFPEACAKRFGCARVADAAPHRAGGETPLRLRTTLDGAQAAVAAFVTASPRADVLFAGGDGSARAVHARFLSLLFGFADDVHVRLTCGRDGRVVVETQGQLRLGVGDAGVNARRNAALLRSLREAEAEGRLQAGACATRWRRAGPGGML